MEKNIRCFVALDLPYSIIEEAKTIQADIKKHDLIIGNYTKPENIHLTLKFLAEIPEEEIDEVKEALREVKAKSFEAAVDELGVFSPEFARIIWLHLNGQEVLDLQKTIDESLVKYFPKEQRFQSHITIARVHNLKSKEELLNYVKSFKVNETRGKILSFSLMKSTLTAQGSVFEVIERYELN
ncbi:RNA 2',3'-cyclic phosphodiesterase [Candidatus Woesearchaeota archaeon]|nr:RNA 2',3'-cyclic phosphodiesterase [Candidatus Woesearchaeota archaeon]